MQKKEILWALWHTGNLSRVSPSSRLMISWVKVQPPLMPRDAEEKQKRMDGKSLGENLEGKPLGHAQRCMLDDYRDSF